MSSTPIQDKRMHLELLEPDRRPYLGISADRNNGEILIAFFRDEDGEVDSWHAVAPEILREMVERAIKDLECS